MSSTSNRQSLQINDMLIDVHDQHQPRSFSSAAHQLIINPKSVVEQVGNYFNEDDLALDKSDEAKKGRRQMMYRAIYGEFIATTILFITIFGVVAHGYQNNWDEDIVSFTAALLSGLQVCALSFTFSDMSGAQMNCAISFSLWLTKRLSNRKFILYLIFQLIASIFATVIIYLTFKNANKELFTSISVKPVADTLISQVFLTEFVCTFILAYVAFTTAFEENEKRKKETMSFKAVANSQGLALYSSTPDSKSGFAPFAIGFTVFSLSLYGGSSGISMNPCRM